MKDSKIVQMYAEGWLMMRANITKTQKALVLEFASEIDAMLEDKEEDEKK
jgi:hypothetical protein